MNNIIVKKSEIVKGKKEEYWLNTLTNRRVSEGTAKRLNSYFKKYPNATLYEAYGGGVYDREKGWTKQPASVKKAYEKSLQVIRTWDITGKKVYFAPLRKTKYSQEEYEMFKKFDYIDGPFKVALYRLTTEEDIVYHILTCKLGVFLNSEEGIEQFFKRLKHYWSSDAKRVIKDVGTRHRLAKYQLISIKFQTTWHLTKYKMQDDGVIACGYATLMEPKDYIHKINSYLDDAKAQYLAKLYEYKALTIHDVRIYIHAHSNPATRALGRSRIGVYKRNGN